jgi:hypothetical protein
MSFLLVVTGASMLLAAIMSIVAWRIAAEERRRSDARVAVLAAEIHPREAAQPRAVAAQSSRSRRAEIGIRAEPPRISPALVRRASDRWDDDLHIRDAADQRGPAPELFARPLAGSRLGVLAAIGAIAVAAAFALVAVLGRGLPAGRGSRPIERPASSPVQSQTVAAAPASASAAPVPLELLALGHDREADRLTVRGIVRNPAAGGAVEPLTAVVFAFGPDGRFLASGRAIIESSSLRPGGQSTFVVIVPGAATVGRYRVSFRTGDRIVPHVDRREPPKASS